MMNEVRLAPAQDLREVLDRHFVLGRFRVQGAEGFAEQLPGELDERKELRRAAVDEELAMVQAARR